MISSTVMHKHAIHYHASHIISVTFANYQISCLDYSPCCILVCTIVLQDVELTKLKRLTIFRMSITASKESEHHTEFYAICVYNIKSYIYIYFIYTQTIKTNKLFAYCLIYIYVYIYNLIYIYIYIYIYISKDIHEFSTLISRLEADPIPVKGLNL